MSKQKQRVKFDFGVIGDITEKHSTINSTNDGSIDSTNDSTNDSTKDSSIDSTKNSTKVENTEVKGNSTTDATTDATTDSTINSTNNSTINATTDSTISITIKRQENYLDKHVQRAYYIRKDLEGQLIKTSKKTKVPKSELVNMALELLFENLKIEG